MQQLTTKISASGIDFNFVTSYKIESSYELLTDVGTAILPRKIILKNEQGKTIAVGASAIFKRGDVFKLQGGYNQNVNEIFNGVIAGVKPKFPIEFSLEDQLYNLKQSSLTLSLKNPTLTQLLEKVLPAGTNYEQTAEYNLGDFRISNASPARVLDELRKKHGIYSFYREGKLYIGLAVVPKLQKTVRFTLFKDVIDFKGLTYLNDFDRKIKVVAKSIKDDNTQLEATVGDEDGEQRTLYFYNIENLSDLEEIAEGKIDQLKYSGYEGSFKTFLTPQVKHGDIVELINPQIEENSGGYICNKVVSMGGVKGGRQQIYLKQKVYDLVKNQQGEWKQK